MDLNLSNQIFTSSRSNNFKTSYKDSYDIAQVFQNNIKEIVSIKNENISQTYQPTCGVIKNDTLYIGDMGGFVSEVNTDNTFSILYQHNLQVTSLIVRETTNQIISASLDENILIFDFNEASDPTVMSSPEPILILVLSEQAKILFSGGKSGEIILWNLIAMQKLSKIKTENSIITSLSFSSKLNKLFIGNESGKIFIYESFTRKTSQIKVTDFPISSITIDPQNEEIFFSTIKGQIESINIESLQKSKQMNQFSSDKICQIFFTNRDTELIALNIKGAIIKYSTLSGMFDEWRLYQKEGNYKAIYNRIDNLAYIIGFKNVIEKWSFNTSQMLQSFQRHEIPSLDKYSFYNYNEKRKEYYTMDDMGFLVIYDIGYDINSNQIQQRINLELTNRIMKFFRQKNYLFLICTEFLMIIFDVVTKQKIHSMKIPCQCVVSVQLTYNKETAYLLEDRGKLMILDMKTMKIKEEVLEQGGSIILTGFLSPQEKNFFIIKQQGNIVIRNISSKYKMLNNIVNDENITSFLYCQKENILYTGDLGGSIVQTKFIGEEKMTSVEILDRNLQIDAIAVDLKHEILAYATYNQKIFLYHIQKNFQFDQIGKTYYNIQYIFFNDDGKGLISAGENGVLQYWELTLENTLQSFQSFSKEIINSIELNDQRIFLLSNQSMIVWNIENQIMEKKIKGNFSNTIDMKISPNGEFLILIQEEGQLQKWSTLQLEVQEEIKDLDGTNDIISLDISDDSQLLLISFNSKRTILYDIKNQKVERDIFTFWELRHVQIVGNQEYIISEFSPGQLCILNLDGDIESLIGKQSNFVKGYIVSKDHNYVYLVYRDGSIQVWDVFNSEVIFYFENKGSPINDVSDSFSGNELYVLGNRGELNYYDVHSGRLYKEIQLGNFTKTMFLKRYNNKLLFLSNNIPYMISLHVELTFYERQYIKKTFIEHGKTNSEKNFINYFNNIIDYYKKSRFLQIYFNPFFACALFNYQRGLQNILDLKIIKYPMINDHNQISPLVLALKLEHLNLAEMILQTLTINAEQNFFSNREMKILLDSKYEFTHKYLSYFLIQMNQFTGSELNIPILSRLNQKYRIDIQTSFYFTPKKYQMITKPIMNIDEQDMKKTFNAHHTLKEKRDLTVKEQEDLISKLRGHILGDAKSVNTSHQSTEYSIIDTHIEGKIQQQTKKNISWTPTKFYRVNGIFSFQIGTEESLFFLEHYSNSQVKEFVLSNWKYIIDYKWAIIFKRLIIPSALNWCHALFFNLALLLPDYVVFFIIDYVFIALIFGYEFISMYSSGLTKYISSFNNLFDMLIIFLCIVVNAFTYEREGIHDETDILWLEILQLLCLFVIYYRSITFLRIFKTFRNVIDMLLSVTLSALSLIIIIALFILGISVMFTKAKENGNDEYNIFLQNTLFSIQGEIAYDMDEFNSLSWIIFILNSILLPIILINFLIAKMSNKYVELEEIEEVTSYKEKAELIAEIEYFYLIQQKRQLKKSNLLQIKQQKQGFTFIARNANKDPGDEQDQQIETFNSMDAFYQKIEYLNKQFKKEISHREIHHQQTNNNFQLISTGMKYLKNDLLSIKSDNQNLKKKMNNLFLQIENKIQILHQKLVEEIKRQDDVLEKLKKKNVQ